MCWLVSAKNDEKVLRYAITSRRSPSESRPFQAGIALPGSPSSIARIRSASVGSWPLPVVRTLRSEEHTSELQSRLHLVCRLLLEKKKKTRNMQCCLKIELL